MQVVSREVNHALLAAPTDGSVRGVAERRVGSHLAHRGPAPGPRWRMDIARPAGHRRGRSGGRTRGRKVTGADRRLARSARRTAPAPSSQASLEVRAAQPRLVLAERNQVLLKLDRPKHIELLGRRLPDGAAAPHAGPASPPTGTTPALPSSIATVGARDRHRLLPVVGPPAGRGGGRGGPPVHRDATLPTRSPAPYPRIATSQGRAFVADGDCSSSFDCRGHVGDRRADRWVQHHRRHCVAGGAAEDDRRLRARCAH